jgi:hypothetical protein
MVLDCWSARRVQPIVLLYVIAVFAGFVAMAYFVFHSGDAVKALVIAAVGALAATVPSVIGKVEYRLNDSGIDKRPVNEAKPHDFEGVFSWDELSHVVPLKQGFKYFKTMKETSAVRRFWNLHISDRFSGEVHVEKSDLERVLKLVEKQGIPIS